MCLVIYIVQSQATSGFGSSLTTSLVKYFGSFTQISVGYIYSFHMSVQLVKISQFFFLVQFYPEKNLYFFVINIYIYLKSSSAPH